MNNRANIMYFIEHLCELAIKENHPPYVRMMQRDILRVVDSVVPPDGTGAANVKHVRHVLNGLQAKEVLTVERVAEIDAALKDRESDPSHLDLEHEEGTEEGSKLKTEKPQLRLDKKQIEQRIEEDRERNKRLRESMWAMTGSDQDEYNQMWDELSPIGEDDFIRSREEALERAECARKHVGFFKKLYGIVD
jgi:CTD kinase subunit gamma